MKDVVLVIPSCGRTEILTKALISAREVYKGKIIIVGQGYKESDIRGFLKISTDIHYKPARKINVGYARDVALAIAVQQAENYIVIMDDDVNLKASYRSKKVGDIGVDGIATMVAALKDKHLKQHVGLIAPDQAAYPAKESQFNLFLSARAAGLICFHKNTILDHGIKYKHINMHEDVDFNYQICFKSYFKLMTCETTAFKLITYGNSGVLAGGTPKDTYWNDKEKANKWFVKEWSGHATINKANQLLTLNHIKKLYKDKITAFNISVKFLKGA